MVAEPLLSPEIFLSNVLYILLFLPYTRLYAHLFKKIEKQFIYQKLVMEAICNPPFLTKLFTGVWPENMAFL